MAIRPENVISLCTGGGGFDLAFKLAVPAARTVCVVEREAFAVSHLVSKMQAGQLDECPVWSDVTTFSGRAWRGAVDWVIGGIPCQPHSAAGKRLGREDERDLWADARRIFVQTGARGIVIENVEGMLSTGGAERVYRDLERLGCLVEIGLFSAAEVGFTHRRNRVVIIGIRSGVGQADACRPGPQGIRASDHASGRENPERHAGLCGGTVLAHSDRRQPQGRGCEPAGPEGSRPYGEPARSSVVLGNSDSEAQSTRQGQPEQSGRRRRVSGDGRYGSNTALVNAASDGRGEGRPQSDIRSGRDATASTERALADAGGRDGDGRTSQPQRRQSERADDQRTGRYGLPLSPPGPGDTDAWRTVLESWPELKPAVCRVADRLANRVDRLRMCGNGVHPLAISHGIRTLIARLRARTSGSGEPVMILEK